MSWGDSKPWIPLWLFLVLYGGYNRIRNIYIYIYIYITNYIIVYIITVNMYIYIIKHIIVYNELPWNWVVSWIGLLAQLFVIIMIILIGIFH